MRLDRETIADLRLVGADGRTMLQLLRSNAAPPGESSFSVDLRGVAPGACFVVLKTNEGMIWEKVVIGQ